MNRKQKITVSVIGLFIVLLSLIGITFGYFLTNIKGNTNDKSIDILSAYLELTYTDGNGTIKKENIEPGDVIEEKTFRVKNTGNVTIDSYGVYLEEVLNTFEIKEDVTYTLTCTSSKSGKTCNGAYETTYPSLNELLVTNSIEKDEVHSYTLKVVYKETGADQSADMKKKIEGKVQIYDQRDVVYLTGTVTGYNEGDYVLVSSDPKKSRIVNGKYKVVGLKPESHSIKVVGSDNVVKGTKNFEIVKENMESINGDVISINNDTDHIIMNVNAINSNLSVNINF